MKTIKFLFRKRVPCKKCPYKLGQIRTPINPCPQCELSGYKTYEEFNKQLSKKNM